MDREVTGEDVPTTKSGMKRPLRILWGFLIVVFLLVGLIGGLQVSGGLVALTDSARPFLLRVPLVGEPVLAFLDAGKKSMTAHERRTQELEETREALLAWETELKEEERRLTRERAALEKLQASLDEREDIFEAESGPAQDAAGAFSRLVAGFEEMSSRKAAGIIARLPRERALAVMKALSQEKMSEILAKMDPAVAARMVEALSKEGAS